MATGASTADLAIILVDARKGVLASDPPPRLHRRLLGIPHVVAAVNKMDLVDFSEEVFNSDPCRLHCILRQLGDISACISNSCRVSALDGDNVVNAHYGDAVVHGTRAARTPSRLSLCRRRRSDAFRFAVQRVIRPNQRLSRLCRTDRRRHDSPGGRQSWSSRHAEQVASAASSPLMATLRWHKHPNPLPLPSQMKSMSAGVI